MFWRDRCNFKYVSQWLEFIVGFQVATISNIDVIGYDA